jgi:ferredoxin
VRIKIDRELCAGHAQCYLIAPELFTVDEQGYGVVLAEEFDDSLRELAVRAAANCPERVIQVEGLPSAK